MGAEQRIIGGGQNLGNANLVQSSTGERNFTLGGTLSTDKLVFYRGGGSIPLFTMQGDGAVIVGRNVSSQPHVLINESGGQLKLNAGSNCLLNLYGNGTAENQFNIDAGAVFNLDAGKKIRIVETSVGSLFLDGDGIELVSSQEPHGGNNVFVLQNGTAPTTDRADKHLYYSADIVAGNAAPHFRTELGDVIKLYKYVDAALANTANSGDANTDALITALKDLVIALGIGASA